MTGRVVAGALFAVVLLVVVLLVLAGEGLVK